MADSRLSWTGSKKNLAKSIEAKRLLIETNNPHLSIYKQCQLLGLNRASYYYQAVGENQENLLLMRQIDEQYLETPFYGTRRMAVTFGISRKRAQRLMRLMGLEAIYPKPNTSSKHPQHKIYPYLLKGVEVNRVNQVWSTDITYIPMARGFLYLVAVMDWYSRYVLSWTLSNTLHAPFFVEALEMALQHGKPEIFNTDQGTQFTSEAFTTVLLKKDIRISMDGRGRCFDNIFIERLWRTVKYEHVYLYLHESGEELYHGLRDYFNLYNTKRPHPSFWGPL